MAARQNSPRQLAIGVLVQWEKTKNPVDRIFNDLLAGYPLPDLRDRGLALALVAGVLRWQGYLDWLLQQFSSHPLQKMRPLTRQALRTGAFQLCFLDRVPASAAINETVKVLRDARQPSWITGFVNGILRNIARSQPARPDDDALPMPESARLNHPDWLVSRWQQRYGTERCKGLCQANNRLPESCLRVNTKAMARDAFMAQLAAAGIGASPGRFAPETIRLQDFHGSPAEIPGYDQGFFQVQDEAAQLVTLLLQPLPEEGHLLDACAGLGGKTSHLAQLLAVSKKDGRIIALEPNRDRQELLRQNLDRLGLAGRVSLVPDRLENFAAGNAGPFDRILLDAPCSGLGVIRRHPDIKWSRAEADLPRYQAQQLGLLSAAAPLLAAEGVLVYTTCSTEPEENDAVIDRFLESNPEFRLTDCAAVLPAVAAELVDDRGCLRTLPDMFGLDGFFAARLKKDA